jgi:hypothetical protein
MGQANVLRTVDDSCRVADGMRQGKEGIKWAILFQSKFGWQFTNSLDGTAQIKGLPPSH